MELTLTAEQVMLGLSILAISIIIGIIGQRIYSNRRQDLSTDNRSYYTKYKSVDFLSSISRNWLLGLSSSLATILILMSWTTYKSEAVIKLIPYAPEPMEFIPRTATPPPEPPPPPPPPVIKVTEDLVENPPDLVDTSMEPEEPIFTSTSPTVEDVPPPPLPPPLPPPKDDVGDIVDWSEEMPMFGGCKDKSCSDEKLIKYLAKNIKYPSIAQQNGIKGRVYARFVVEKDGSISDVQIIRGIGAGCDKEVLRVVKKMNSLSQGWTPGKHRGRTMRVKYTLPVTFQLSN